MRKQRSSPLLSLAMILAAAVVGVPFYYIVVNTFKTQQETSAAPLAPPTSLYLDNYTRVFESTPILQSFLNTLYVTAVSIVIMLVIGSMAAYAMLLRKTLLNRVVGVLLVIAFLVPGQATLIPVYRPARSSATS
jgi:raffinose/stachyose/melibiose transport system permease protein